MKQTQFAIALGVSLFSASGSAVFAWDEGDPMRPQPTPVAQQATVIENVRIAIQSTPQSVVIQPSRPGAYGFYNLVVENLCGANGLANKLTSWVDERDANSWYGGTTRTAALVAVVTPQGKAQFKVPVIAVSNSATQPGVKPCGDQFVFTDVPYGLPVRIHFEFATKEETQLRDPKALLDALGAVATAAATVQSAGGSLVFGTGAGVVVSFLKADSGPVVQMTGAVNSLLKLMNIEGNPRPTSVAIDTSSSKLRYQARKQDVFVLNKNWRPAKANFDPNTGYGYAITTAYSAAYENRNPHTTFGTLMAAQSDWTTKPDKFCNSLRAALNVETGGDTYAVLVLMAAHAFHYSAQYAEFPDTFKKTKRTCLLNSEAKLLLDDHWAEPFEGAWPPRSPQVIANNPKKKG